MEKGLEIGILLGILRKRGPIFLTAESAKSTKGNGGEFEWSGSRWQRRWDLDMAGFEGEDEDEDDSLAPGFEDEDGT